MIQILLVEDDQAISTGLSYSLNQEGYGVTVCGRKQEAIEQLKQKQFDLAVLDLSLPDGNGYDICKTIKKRGDTPVIFLTAREDEASVVMGLDMGADDYITKPFRLREFLSRIRTVLRRAGQTESHQDDLTLGDLRLQTKQAKVTKNGEEIFLTALEYRLLLTFAVNQGQILTRDQILSEIWDAGGEYVNDNTLTVYIKRLREKIEADPQNPRCIVTVRGLGYKAGE